MNKNWIRLDYKFTNYFHIRIKDILLDYILYEL